MTNSAAWSLDELIRRTDFLRGPNAAGGSTGCSYKEWFHFLVLADEVELLVNFSLITDSFTGQALPRATILVHDSERFSGEVVEFEEPSITAGTVGMNASQGGFRYQNGRYEIDWTTSANRIQLYLEPLAKPQFSGSVRLGEGLFSWLAIPHLRASGEIVIDGVSKLIHQQPAYHDHNWGKFSWGSGYAWVWSVALPIDREGFGLIYDQVIDTQSRQIVAEGATLIEGHHHHRTFLKTEVTQNLQGMLPGAIFRMPAVMRLASPGSGPSIPQLCEITAGRKRDSVRLLQEPNNCAEIGIPSDVGGTPPMLLSEAFGTGTLEVRLDNREFSNPVRCVYEQIASGRPA